VLLDGSRQPRGIVETTQVEIMPFGAITEEMARAYGEGERTVEWWRRVMGAFYRASAARTARSLLTIPRLFGNGSSSCAVCDDQAGVVKNQES
jgi:ASCH domain